MPISNFLLPVHSDSQFYLPTPFFYAGMLYAPNLSTCFEAQQIKGRTTLIGQRKPAMKKVSTAATKWSRNFSQSNLTIGLDLGGHSICYCVLDQRGA